MHAPTALSTPLAPAVADAATGLQPWLTQALGLLLAAVLTVALERALVHGLRAVLLAIKPLIGGQEATGRLWRYERSLFAPGSADSRIVITGLLVAAVSAWAGWHGQGALFLLAGLALAAALAWDLWTWECVVVSQWQLAWRRGWRRSVRRLPLIQVADVHVVERRAPLQPDWLAWRLGRALGTCYLAIELHNGKAIKLPRTGLLAGLGAVEQVARFLHRHLRVVERERRLAVRQQLRAMRRSRPVAQDPDELALRRELSLLRHQARPARGLAAD